MANFITLSYCTPLDCCCCFWRSASEYWARGRKQSLNKTWTTYHGFYAQTNIRTTHSFMAFRESPLGIIDPEKVSTDAEVLMRSRRLSVYLKSQHRLSETWRWPFRISWGCETINNTWTETQYEKGEAESGQVKALVNLRLSSFLPAFRIITAIRKPLILVYNAVRSLAAISPSSSFAVAFLALQMTQSQFFIFVIMIALRGWKKLLARASSPSLPFDRRRDFAVRN